MGRGRKIRIYMNIMSLIISLLGSKPAMPNTGNSYNPPPIPDYVPKQFVQQLIDNANEYGIPPILAAASIMQESGWNPRAVSKTGATGLGQLTKATAMEHGVTDRFDPQQNLRGSLKHLAEVFGKMKEWNQGISDPEAWKLATAGYNSGENRGAYRRGTIPNIPETIGHVDKVSKYMGIPWEQLQASIKPYDVENNRDSLGNNLKLKALLQYYLNNND